MAQPFKPSKDELRAAAGKTVPDVIAAGLRVLFCGINPGLYSAAVSHHFARPGNRFWPVLHLAGFSGRRLSPFEEQELLQHGFGITNLVERATAVASDLAPEELIAGRQWLEDKVQRYRPRVVAVLGVGAFQTAFGRPKAGLGRQQETLGAPHEAVLWVLPNPSGLNAHYQLDALAQLFRQLHQAVDAMEGS